MAEMPSFVLLVNYEKYSSLQHNTFEYFEYLK